MNKIFSFMAGAISGALIGSVAALLLTPNSGEQLINGVQERFNTAMADARQAMADKQHELEIQFEQAKKGQ
jgi:gas vesicle protein